MDGDEAARGSEAETIPIRADLAVPLTEAIEALTALGLCLAAARHELAARPGFEGSILAVAVGKSVEQHHRAGVAVQALRSGLRGRQVI